jgi:hypothetical protein
MQRGRKTVLILMIAAAILGAASHKAVRAQVHDGGICIDPDVEFPVACDEDDD